MDRIETTIGAAIKAMNDVVIPSVDTSDPLASEQAELVRDFLHFLKGRVYSIHPKAVIELADVTRLLEKVVDEFENIDAQIHEDAKAALEANLGHLESGTPDTVTLLTAKARALALVRTLIRHLDTKSNSYREVRQAVLESVEGTEEFQRVWFAPLGFDQNAAELPEFELSKQEALLNADVRHLPLSS